MFLVWVLLISKDLLINTACQLPLLNISWDKQPTTHKVTVRLLDDAVYLHLLLYISEVEAV